MWGPATATGFPGFPRAQRPGTRASEKEFKKSHDAELEAGFPTARQAGQQPQSLSLRTRGHGTDPKLPEGGKRPPQTAGGHLPSDCSATLEMRRQRHVAWRSLLGQNSDPATSGTQVHTFRSLPPPASEQPQNEGRSRQAAGTGARSQEPRPSARQTAWPWRAPQAAPPGVHEPSALSKERSLRVRQGLRCADVRAGGSCMGPGG